MNYEYKCVSFPLSVTVDKAHSLESAIQGYQDKINVLSKDGWEFVSSDSLTTVQNPGCLGGLFGQAATQIPHKFIIFRKPEQTML
jgi:hypothetical protein